MQLFEQLEALEFVSGRFERHRIFLERFFERLDFPPGSGKIFHEKPNKPVAP
ncbi:hypothetical protein [Polaromonas sp.]|uniref:hypothetical protein n=1 Tax=Polaromonas sp. TaxID=1869339 RepID=UPI0013BE1507|nr:hypothetical protein [Polaromonas sp.]NDP64650.1 hypothetical protein [Polaromonas sp.]